MLSGDLLGSMYCTDLQRSHLPIGRHVEQLEATRLVDINAIIVAIYDLSDRWEENYVVISFMIRQGTAANLPDKEQSEASLSCFSISQAHRPQVGLFLDTEFHKA